jgi:RNA polymerase sigma-70 factor (ECF subfamily)
LIIDEDLYKSFLNGNNESFNELVMRYKTQLERFINRYIKDKETIQDISQDVFLYLIVKKKDYDFKYSFKTYLYTIARCRSINYLNRNRIMLDLDDYNSILELDEKIEYKIELKELYKKSIDEINKLTNNQKMSMLLLKDGFTNREIAKIIGKNELETKMIIYRARKKLKNKLEKEVL